MSDAEKTTLILPHDSDFRIMENGKPSYSIAPGRGILFLYPDLHAKEFFGIGAAMWMETQIQMLKNRSGNWAFPQEQFQLWLDAAFERIPLEQIEFVANKENS